MRDIVIYDVAMMGGRSGATAHARAMAEGLAAQVELVLIVSDDSFDGNPLLDGTRQFRIPLPFRAPAIIRFMIVDIIRLVHVLRLILARGPERVTVLARLCPLNGSVLVARAMGVRVVLEVNGPMAAEVVAARRSRLVSRIIAASERGQLRAAHVAICVTEGLADYAANLGAERTVVVPNGAVRLVEPMPGAAGIDGLRGGPVLGYSGSETPWYDLQGVLTSAVDVILKQPELGRATFLWIGGADSPSIAGLKDCFGQWIDIVATPWTDDRGVADQLGHCDIGLLPLVPKSMTVEAIGSPLKLYSYLRAGIPVVAPQLDGIEEVVSPLIHLYPHGDAEGRTEALTRALAAGRRPAGSQPHEWSWESRVASVVAVLTPDVKPQDKR